MTHMRRWFMTAAVMAGAMLLIAAAGDAATRRAAAQAQPAPAAAADENGPSNVALAALLPSEPGSRACYVRTYDATHLREHHNQRVTAVMFLLRVARLDADGNQHFTPAAAAYSQDRIRYQFAMQVKRRGAHGTLGAAGDCFGNEEAHCVVDCDGGGVNLAKGPQPDTLLVRLRDNGIRMHGSCDDEKVVWLRPGSDDKVFRVDKVVLDQCRRLENDELGE